MRTSRSDEYRRLIRYVAAILSGMTAAIYLLIGFHILIVIEEAGDQVFGLFAGAAYALGTLLLVRYDRRTLWIVGALLQIFVIFTYFNMASQRAPAFETWGIALRIIQLLLLIALAYLAIRPPPEALGDRSRKAA